MWADLPLEGIRLSRLDPCIVSQPNERAEFHLSLALRAKLCRRKQNTHQTDTEQTERKKKKERERFLQKLPPTDPEPEPEPGQFTTYYGTTVLQLSARM